MSSHNKRIGGRPPQVTRDDIVAAGRAMGMRELSLKAVAVQLGVSATALYRHVGDRWGLEKLVGESFLADFVVRDDPHQPLAAHLLSFGMDIRRCTLETPGLAAYLQTLFPRGEGGRAVLAAEVKALVRRGYQPDTAIVLCSAVASIAIGYAAAEDLQRDRRDDIDVQREEALAQLRADEHLAEGQLRLPEIDADAYVRFMLSGVVKGFLEAAPPGRGLAEVMTDLDGVGKDL